MSIIYRRIIQVADKFVPQKLQPFWNHEAGPKTVFFWAPAVKWGLVIAGIGDLARPAEKLSMAQSGALSATGVIWSRYSLVIIPKKLGTFWRERFRRPHQHLPILKSRKVSWPSSGSLFGFVTFLEMYRLVGNFFLTTPPQTFIFFVSEGLEKNLQ
ncbi:unnamed protein product [Nesidiocoris tenuis]|uniref:Mitochondrial pyruvate carrier n=1 Tax=Nesidiocoris tenuis TaxID=355587 RepID=A0A6H5GXY7_9HEMI|nr:unnamed protein product [Nesidiocoris tenuis]